MDCRVALVWPVGVLADGQRLGRCMSVLSGTTALHRMSHCAQGTDRQVLVGLMPSPAQARFTMIGPDGARAPMCIQILGCQCAHGANAVSTAA